MSGGDPDQVKPTRSVTAALGWDPARVAADVAEGEFFHASVSLPERMAFPSSPRRSDKVGPGQWPAAVQRIATPALNAINVIRENDGRVAVASCGFTA